ncbi:MAG: VRR-NUC domain-containing protein [Rhabdochlamydiaceae bacterium]
MKTKAIKLSEYQEQCLVAEYLDILKTQGKIVMYTSIPNSTWTPSFGQKIKNKKAGLNPGFPDLIILTGTKAFVIEMKVKPNKQTEEQLHWQVALGLAGIKSYVAYGYEKAKEIINQEIKSK